MRQFRIIQPQFALMACTLVRNEARWLPEWVEHHALPSVAVAHFALYDDRSSDDLSSALRPYVQNGLVTLHANFTASAEFRSAPSLHAPCREGETSCAFPVQQVMVRSCIRSYGHFASWLALIDVDEFLIPPAGYASVASWLVTTMSRDIGALVLKGVVMVPPSAQLPDPYGGHRQQSGAPPHGTLSVQFYYRRLGRFGEVDRRAGIPTTKCLVRPEAVHPSRYNTIHKISLDERYRYLDSSNVRGYRKVGAAYAHFRFRRMATRNGSDYFGPSWAQRMKSLTIAEWDRMLRSIPANLSGTAAEVRLMRFATPVLHQLATSWENVTSPPHHVAALIAAARRFSRRAVVLLVAPGRSGSTTLGHAAFASQPDFLYWCAAATPLSAVCILVPRILITRSRLNPRHLPPQLRPLSCGGLAGTNPVGGLRRACMMPAVRGSLAVYSRVSCRRKTLHTCWKNVMHCARADMAGQRVAASSPLTPTSAVEAATIRPSPSRDKN